MEDSHRSEETQGEATARFTTEPRGPFSLAASANFLEGFTPAAYEGAPQGHVHLAFTVDGTGDAVGACITQDDEQVAIETYGDADPALTRDQALRILSLDVDGSGFAVVGQRDPVIGRIQQRFLGFRPVLFNSPYEAAAWALIGHRIRIVQAAKLKARIGEEIGLVVDIHGDLRHAFPDPARLAESMDVAGLPDRKAEYLQALTRATQAGELDVMRLRSLSWDEAMASLMELPGIGPFSAELILLRGVGMVDQLPGHEQRFPRAVALAYDLPAAPEVVELEAMAEPWRPFRTWVAVLLRTMLEQETGETNG